MMYQKKSLGFTLIELLVVIAIIGTLSAVVLASLSRARSKAADAAIKANLSHVRSQAEILNVDNTGYASACSDTKITQAVEAALTAAGVSNPASEVGNHCFADYATWTAWSPLKSDPTSNWCVDISGFSGVVTTPPSAGELCTP